VIQQSLKFAFLVPFFGKLPPYFDFWAKSCELNHERFHWFVYSDQISSSYELNKSVTMIPYQFEEMRSDISNILHINIPEENKRKVCDYRIMFYFLRRHREPLDLFDYIGYTDVDMVYGKIEDFFPENIQQYVMISADEGRPCGPFTLIKRSSLQTLLHSVDIKRCFEAEDHLKFDESERLLSLIRGGLDPVFCHHSPLQPQRAERFNYKRCLSIWENGKVSVWDSRCNKKAAAFFHFSRFKGRNKFIIRTDALQSQNWVICKYGIFPLRSKAAKAVLNILRFIV
jgi:hypothetical protein